MSLEAWGDEGDTGMDGYVTEDRAAELFRAGAQAMREMLARHFESAGHDLIPKIIRDTWHEGWGNDPGDPSVVVGDIWDA